MISHLSPPFFLSWATEVPSRSGELCPPPAPHRLPMPRSGLPKPSPTAQPRTGGFAPGSISAEQMRRNHRGLLLVYDPSGPNCRSSASPGALTNQPLPLGSVGRWWLYLGRGSLLSVLLNSSCLRSGAAREDSQRNQQDFFPVICAKSP